MIVTELGFLEIHMWFVIGLPGGSHGMQASDDGSEDRSSAVILDSTLKRLFIGPAMH